MQPHATAHAGTLRVPACATIERYMDAYPLYELSDNDFPGALREIPDRPTKLYARGGMPPRDHKLLAVVGSRRYTTYGKQAVAKLISGLAGYPITVISGLAIGIDSLAHHAALEHGLNTLAVPGSGIADKVLYPVRNRALAHEILRAGGGLASEFEPNFHATPWSFPQRNRIMAGMADAVLLIEATLKSGTLVTARLTVDYNRELLAVPGSIFSTNSEGTHLFLKLGATLVSSSNDILTVLGFEPGAPAMHNSLETLTPQERALIDALASPRTRDELIRILKCPAAETTALIMLMELRGYINETNGIIIKT